MKYPVSEIKCSKCSMCQLVEKISLDPIAGTNIYYKCLAKAENECKKESEKSGFNTLDAIKYLIEGKKIRKKNMGCRKFLVFKRWRNFESSKQRLSYKNFYTEFC